MQLQTALLLSLTGAQLSLGLPTRTPNLSARGLIPGDITVSVIADALVNAKRQEQANHGDHQTKSDLVEASLSSSLGSSLNSNKRVRRDEQSVAHGLSNDDISAILASNFDLAISSSVSPSQKRGLLDGISANLGLDSTEDDSANLDLDSSEDDSANLDLDSSEDDSASEDDSDLDKRVIGGLLSSVLGAKRSENDSEVDKRVIGGLLSSILGAKRSEDDSEVDKRFVGELLGGLLGAKRSEDDSELNKRVIGGLLSSILGAKRDSTLIDNITV